MNYESPTVSDYDTAIDAYVMVRDILAVNELILDGKTPVDAEGQPLFVGFQTDRQIQTGVRQMFGTSPRIENAVQAAYDTNLKKMFQDRGIK